MATPESFPCFVYLVSPTEAELLTLLARARKVLETHMFDEDEICRDDVAEVCQATDDAVPEA
jgi:hypothetical protein